ncbi:MAG: MFS transporter, partial [Nocardioidaceae bacterium]
AFGGLLLLGARAGDLVGRRRIFLIGIGLFTIASLLGGLATSAGWLLAARTAQGVGGALAAPVSLALLTSTFAEGRERTRALGLYTAVSIGGAAIGLVAGGMLTEWASWRWVMFVNVPIGAALLAAAAVVVSESPRVQGRFDLAGAVTSTVGMTSLVYGFVHAASDGWGNPTTVAAFAAGVVLAVAFVVIERRAVAPITPLPLFADRIRSGAYVARMLLVAGMTGMFFFLTQFLQDVLHYSPLQTGLGFLPVTIALFGASQASARTLIERFGERLVLIVGASLSTLSLLWMTQLSAQSGYTDVLGPLVLLGVGNGLAFVPLTSAALSGVKPEHAGAASGLVNVTQQVGGSLGLAVLVTVFGTASRHVTPLVNSTPAEQTRQVFVAGADAAFLVAAILLAITVGLATTVLRRRPDLAAN